MSPAQNALDEAAARVLAFLQQAGAPKVHELPVAQARAVFEAMAPQLDMPPEPMAEIADRTIPAPGGARAVRLYRPRAGMAGAPVILFFHGGGWVIGSIATHDRVCRRLAAAAGAIVVSVDYRLAPEHPFPAAVEDVLAAFAWAGKEAAELGGDPRALFVAGDSAGGNLAAVAALAARDGGDLPSPAGQLLFYPAVDLAGDYESRRRFAEGYFLEQQTMKWFVDKYIPDPAAREDWRASPLRAGDHRGLAPAFVLTAGFDPLWSEGQAYAKTLEAAGVPVTVSDWPGLIHGFLNMGGLVPAAAEALDAAGAWVRQQLSAKD